MGIFAKYPYTDFSNINLDWIIEKIRETMNTQEKQQAYMEMLKAWMDENEPKIDNIEEYFRLFEAGQLPSAVVTALENWLTQYGVLAAANDYTDEKAAALENSLTAETAARSAADAVLQSQIDNIIAPSGEAPSAAEVENARIGYNGFIYDTLGNAIRSQISNIRKDIENLVTYDFQYLDKNNTRSGYYYHDATTNYHAGGGYIFYGFPVQQNKTYYYRSLRGYFCKLIYNDGTVDYLSDSDSIVSGSITAAKNGKAYITSSIALINEAQFSDAPLLSYAVEYGPYNVMTENSLLATYPNLIVAENYLAELDDLNNANDNTIYILNFANQATAIPAHYPLPQYDAIGTTFNWLYTYYPSNRTNMIGKTQILRAGNNSYIRFGSSASVFGNWRLMPGSYGITVNKTGGAHFTSLSNAIAFAERSLGNTVYVDPGTYDLVAEFGDNLNVSSGFRGIELQNDVHIIFSPNAKVTFNYTGSNEWVLSHVSPFNANASGFSIENLNLEASNCRYCIHDERGDTSGRYVNRYTNCTMKLDNSNNSAWSSRQCVGGGLGGSGNIVMRGCVFESVGVTDNSALVSYHNNSLANSKSFVDVQGCYFKRGTVRASYYGQSTDISTFLVANNSMTADPIVTAETAESTIVNVELIAFNNEIR